MHRQRAGTESSTGTGHTGRYLKDADQYTLPQNILYFSVCLIGAGFIVLPYITVVLSTPVVVGCLIVLGATSCYTNKIIIEMAEDYQLNSLEEIGEYCFGRVGYYITWLSAFAFSFTSALVCLSGATELLGSVIGRNVQFSANLKSRSISRLFMVLAVAAPSLLISIIRVPRKIVVFNFFALCAAVSTGCVLLAMMASQIDTKSMPQQLSCWMPPKSINAEYVESLVLISFCFVGHHKSLDAFQHLRLRDESGRWSRVVVRSSLVVFGVYCITALSSMVCSYNTQQGTHQDFCSNVKEHSLFDLFLAVTLILMVPTDISTMRRLAVRLVSRHGFHCLTRNASRSSAPELDNGSLIVFSQHGVPTLQGMALSGEHFMTTSPGFDSCSDSSASRGSGEMSVKSFSPPNSPLKTALSPLPRTRTMVRRVTISEIVTSGLSAALLEEGRSLGEEREGNGKEGKDTGVEVAYEPPHLEQEGDRVSNKESKQGDEDTLIEPLEESKSPHAAHDSLLTPVSDSHLDYLDNEREDSNVRDDSESSVRSSSTSTRQDSESSTSNNETTASSKRNLVTKIRKGVARKTGAHGFFTRSSSMPEQRDHIVSHEQTRRDDDSIHQTDNAKDLNPPSSQAERQGHLNPSEVPHYPQSSLLPPQDIGDESSSVRNFPELSSRENIDAIAPKSAVNQSWPHRFRGHSQPEAMVTTSKRTNNESNTMVVDSSGTRREVGAWAFSARPNFNSDENLGEGDQRQGSDGGGYSRGEVRNDFDASEWMSVVSDDMEASSCNLFTNPTASFAHVLPTLLVWLIVTAAVWVTNFAPAVILMTYVAGFGASLLALVLPSAFYFKLAPLSSDFSAIARFGALSNQSLMILVLLLGLFFFITKSGLIVMCSSINSDWCYSKKDISLVAEGHGHCFS